MPSRLIPAVALLLSALAPALRAELAPSAAETRPLATGTPLPAVTVRTVEGSPAELRAICADQPTVLIFYRGSWCPYCNRHLAALAEAEPKLLALGYRIIAVSPDEPAGLRAMAEKNHLNYRLFSDRDMLAAPAFGVAFRVDEKTMKVYAGYGIALAPVPGEPEARWLPVPAVFLIGRDGTIKFVHTNPDYKVRLPTEALLVAAKSAL